MEDYMFSYEEEVTLYLVVELVRHVNGADIAWAWLGPLPANLACLADLRYELQDLFTDTNTVEKSSHCMF